MQKFLVVKLDQYAGNVDELVCVALTGFGSERYGAEQARAVFDIKVKPLLTDPDEDYPELPVGFMDFNTEYGAMAYELDNLSTNNLRLGLDKYATEESLGKMMDIWEEAYGDGTGCLKIVITGLYSDVRPTIIKVLGFDLITTSEDRTKLR